MFHLCFLKSTNECKDTKVSGIYSEGLGCPSLYPAIWVICPLLLCLLSWPRVPLLVSSIFCSPSLSLLTWSGSVWRSSLWTAPGISAPGYALTFSYKKLSPPPYLGEVMSFPFLFLFCFSFRGWGLGCVRKPLHSAPRITAAGVVFVFFLETVVPYVALAAWLVWSSIYRPGWSHTQRDPPPLSPECWD